MSETTEAAVPRSFGQDLLDLYFAPRDAFASILRAPRLAVVIPAWLVLGLVFTGVWLSRVDPPAFMRNQLEESGQWDRLNPEQRSAVLEGQSRMLPIFGWIGATVGPPVMLLVVSGFLLFVFRFFYAAETGFREALAVVAWTYLGVGLVTTPLTLLVMWLKGDWNVSPQEVLQANPTLLLDKFATAKPLWALLGSFDVFSIWIVFLMATGFAVAGRRTTGSALWGVGVGWAIYVLGKVALSFLGSAATG